MKVRQPKTSSMYEQIERSKASLAASVREVCMISDHMQPRDYQLIGALLSCIDAYRESVQFLLKVTSATG